AVEAIADDRRVEAEGVRGVDAELVRAPGARRELDARAAAGQPLDDAPRGDRRLAVDRIVDLARPVVEIDAERELDHAGVAARRAVEHGGVALLDLAAREQLLQRHVRAGILRRDHEAGGVQIEAVRDERAGRQSASSARRPGTVSSPAGLSTTMSQASSYTTRSGAAPGAAPNSGGGSAGRPPSMWARIGPHLPRHAG